MIKTRIIIGYTDFEMSEKISSWQQYNADKEVIDIKFSTAYHEVRREMQYSAMIIFK